MSRSDRRYAPSFQRRTTTLNAIGAIGAATAVGLGAGAAPAMAAPAHGSAPASHARTPVGLHAVPSTPVTVTDRAPQSSVLYTVRAGDTVSAPALRNDSSVSAIIEANGLGPNALIRIGQTLRIPTGGSGGSSSASSGGHASSATSASISHKVAAGDTVSDLAKRYDSSVSAIVKANHLGSNAMIYVGQTLQIPGKGSSSSSGSSSSGGSSSASSGGHTTSATSGSISHKVA